MTFEVNKFELVKNVISPEVANLLYNYLLNKRQVARKLFDSKYISIYNQDYGIWNDEQVPDTYSIYGDVMLDTILSALQGVMEKRTNTKLYPTYSYGRIYKKGDVLKKHKDRDSCEISTTLNLGGDIWPIYLQTKRKEKILLEPGDMLIYSGCELTHWRDKFQGKNCAQVFLHYNKYTKDNQGQNLYDSRPFLGLPSWFKNYKE